MPRPSIDIAGHQIGPGQRCFIIAEAGVNHNGSLDMALRLVDAAVNTGADAVKFQTFKAERLVSPRAPKADYQLQTTDTSESQLDMIRQLELTEIMHRQIKDYCSDKGILFISSPFDEESVDLLAELDVSVFKIPSGEITNTPLLQHVARKGKPMIVSTGMAYLSEVETAVRVMEDSGNQEYVLLHCVSNYPADPADVNLRAMSTIRSSIGAPVGYSDHTMGIEVPIAAVAMGASVIEKHLTLDRNLPGPDQLASLEPREFSAMVKGIRNVESAFGHGRKEPAESEANTTSVGRKSLVAARNLKSGTRLTREHIAIMRPGTGLPPEYLSQIIGTTLKVGLPAGTLLTLDMVNTAPTNS